MRQPIKVSVHPVRRATSGDWEYLLLRRVPSEGGFWQVVAGGVEDGEDLAEAARRELIEETGIVPLALERIDYSYSFLVDDEKITVYIFVAHVAARQEPEISSEHDKYRWCQFDEALGLLYWPEDVEALKRCHKVVLAYGQA